VLWVQWYAIDRAYLDTLRCIEVADTFGAFIGVDNVNDVALIDSVIRAYRFAHITVNAFVGYFKRHRVYLCLLWTLAISKNRLKTLVVVIRFLAVLLCGIRQGGVQLLANFSFKAANTAGGTNAETSPCMLAISLTKLEEMKLY